MPLNVSWSWRWALRGGGAVHRYASDGRLTERITVPARQTTAYAFVG